MLEKTLREYLNAQLFSSPDHHAYAIIDGASAPGFMLQLNSYSEQSRCLYLGELSESLRATAPYLIKIERGGHVTERLLMHWGQNQGIYAIVSSQIDFDTVYKHCRTLLRIKNTDNQTLYFRYYDPRTLHRFFAYANSQQTRKLFGPVQFFLLETTEQTDQNKQISGIQRYWETEQEGNTGSNITHAPITIEPEPDNDSPFGQTIDTLEPEELEWRTRQTQVHQRLQQHAKDSRSGLGMLIIDIPALQQQRLKEEGDFILWYVNDYMPENLPEHHQAFKPEELNTLIKNGRNQAMQQGFLKPENQIDFITLMWKIGANFYETPAFKPIIENNKLTETEQIKQFYDVSENHMSQSIEQANEQYWLKGAI